MQPNIVLLNPLNIETTAGTQPRRSISQKVIDAYAEDMRKGDEFPAIVVFAEKGSERYILAGGFTTLAAHIACYQDKPIRCDLQQGTIYDAKKFAASTNTDHGTRRTAADVENAIEMLLLDPQGEALANSVLAAYVKCDVKTIKRVRDDMILDGRIGQTGKRKYTREDGTEVERPVKKKRKKKAQVEADRAMRQDDYDRQSIIDAVTILRTVPCTGDEAVERYGLRGLRPEFELAYDFLVDALTRMDEKAPEEYGVKVPTNGFDEGATAFLEG